MNGESIMGSMYFWLLPFVGGGWCYPVHYESTEATEMDFVPVTLEDSMNDPWNFDDYTSEGRYKEHGFPTNSTVYPPLFTLFTTILEDTQMSIATRTSTSFIPTRVDSTTTDKPSSTTSATTAKEANKSLNDTSAGFGDLRLLTEDREGMIVLRKVAQIMVLLGDRVIPHIIQQLTVYDNKCKDSNVV